MPQLLLRGYKQGTEAGREWCGNKQSGLDLPLREWNLALYQVACAGIVSLVFIARYIDHTLAFYK